MKYQLIFFIFVWIFLVGIYRSQFLLHKFFLTSSLVLLYKLNPWTILKCSTYIQQKPNFKRSKVRNGFVTDIFFVNCLISFFLETPPFFCLQNCPVYVQTWPVFSQTRPFFWWEMVWIKNTHKKRWVF